MSDLIFSILFYFTQALLMILLGMKLLKIKRECKQVLKTTLFYAFGIWVVRRIYEYFNMPLGSHTIILAILFYFIVKNSLKVNFNYALAIALFDFTLIMLGSCILMHTYPNINFNIPLVDLSSKEYIIFSLLENSFILGVFMLLKISKFDIGRLIGKIEKYN